MAEVTFPTNLGGSGQTISDDSDPNTGLANGGHRLRFVPALQGTIEMAQYVYQYAAKIDAAADDADRAENARGYVESVADAYEVNILEQFRRKATLDLDFARGEYAADDGTLTRTQDASSVLTMTRSTPKWIEGPDGILREVLIDTVAREWRNGYKAGALIERGYKNLAIYSEDISNGAYTKSNLSVLSESIFTPIEGLSSANKLIPDQGITVGPGAGSSLVYQTVLKEGSGRYTFSFIAKKGEHDAVKILIRDGISANSTISTISLSDFSIMQAPQASGEHSNPAINIKPLAGGWALIALSVDVTDTTSIRGYVVPSNTTNVEGDGTSGIYCTAIQIGKTPKPSSYKKTLGTQVTSSPDSLYIPLQKYGPKGFTILWEGEFSEFAESDSTYTFGIGTGFSSGRLMVQGHRNRFWIFGALYNQNFNLSNKIAVSVSYSGDVIVSSGGSSQTFSGIPVPKFSEVTANLVVGAGIEGGSPEHINNCEQIILVPEPSTASVLEELTA